jgi:hypothetical protein
MGEASAGVNARTPGRTTGFPDGAPVWQDAAPMSDLPPAPSRLPGRRLARPAAALLGIALALGVVLASGRAAATVPAGLVEIPSAFLGLLRLLPGLDLAFGLAAPCRAVGWPSFGRLENGVLAKSTPGLFVRSRDSWGTPEVVRALRRVAQEVETLYPGRGDLIVTDISRRRGGHLRPHRTHQNGQDVDLLLYRNKPGPSARSFDEIDVERLWALLTALRAPGTAELVLVDRGVQARLYAYARDVAGVPAAELDALFEYPRQGKRARGEAKPFVRHARGHRTHLHVRFHSPEAIAASIGEDARRGYERVVHVAARGETLASVAAQYGTPVELLATENGLSLKARLRRGARLFVLRPLDPARVSRDTASENRGG